MSTAETHIEFLTTRDAAAYVGYSYDYFRILIKKYNIPRQGNGKNRIAIADLKRWMRDPTCFMGMQSMVNAVRKIKLIPIKGVTP